MNAFDEIFAEAYARALTAYLKASGGEAEVHARDFGLSPGEWSRALSRLRRAGRIEPAGSCSWRLVG